MFSQQDLRFVLCSRDLDVLRAQRIIGFFIINTQKLTKFGNPITWQSKQLTPGNVSSVMFQVPEWKHTSILHHPLFKPMVCCSARFPVFHVHHCSFHRSCTNFTESRWVVSPTQLDNASIVPPSYDRRAEIGVGGTEIRKDFWKWNVLSYGVS